MDYIVANSWFGDHANRWLRSICCTCETNGKINLNEIYCFLICCYLINFFLTDYVSWTWAEPNGAICRDARAEWRPLKRGAIVRWQPRSTLCDMFVQPKVVNSVPFRLEWPKHFVSIQKTKQNKIIFISF
jgi:hypothetical protein